MKKLVFFFYTFLFIGNGLLSQPQISWRFANPEIIRLTTTDRLEFDLQVKASQAGTYLWSGQYNITFNNTAFLTTPINVIVLRSGISNQTSDALGGEQKYVITRQITGTAPNLVINVALTPLDAAVLSEEPGVDWSAELTTEWQTFTRLRITINNPGLLAGISFIEASMNGQISYHSAPGVVTKFASPNLYEPLNLNLLHLGRIYSEAHGWSQVGVNQIDWTTPVNTTIFDGNATITQTDHTAALAGNLNVMDGANLTIPSNKWLTVGGTLTTSDTDALTIADGGSLLHNTASVNASIERTISGGSISQTTHRYHLVSVPLSDATVVTAGDIFTGLHLWELNAVSQGWSKINAVDFPINNKNGYLIWHDEVTKSLEMNGLLNATDVELPSISIGTNTDGQSYRLIPNPYPSALSWNTPAGYDAAVYFFNAATGNYVTYAGGVPGPAIAPVGQSFFVKTSVPGNAGTMTISNADRLHHNQNFYKAVAEIPNLLKIKANSETSVDEAYVRFHAQATNLFDAEKDAQKLFGFGDAPQLFTFFEGINYAINTLGLTNNHLVVPMHFKMNSNGMVQLEADGLQSFNPESSVFLEDVYLNQMINLSEQSNYSFEHNQSIPANRFNLHFYGVLDTDETSAASAWKIWSYNKFIYISSPGFAESNVEVTIYDLQGRKLYQQNHHASNPIVIYGGELPQFLVVKINSNTITHTNKIIIR